jgi:hypothetical protein
VADGRVAARTEQALVPVLPANAITLVRHLADHLEDLAHPRRLTDAMTSDNDDVASLCCACGCGHVILLTSDAKSIADRFRGCHRGIH